MGLPGHRRTSSHKRRRASHFALPKAPLGKCRNCGKAIISHVTCPYCGYYKGKKVITVRSTANKTKSK